MKIVAWIRDLFFAVRARDVAAASGCHLTLVKSAAELESILREQPPALAIVDLSVPGLPVGEIVAAAGSVPVLAFGPHMDVAAWKAARAAGVARVVANSTFANRLPLLLNEFVGAPVPAGFMVERQDVANAGRARTAEARRQPDSHEEE